MKELIKTHLVGGDGQGWALDVDLRLTKEALTGVVEFTDDPRKADVIHTVNIEQLVENPAFRAKLLPGKRVVAHFTSTPVALYEAIPGLYDRCKNWICIAQTREVVDQLRALRMPHVRYIPYVGELETFFPISSDSAELVRLRRELGLPDSKYIIGSFQRDTLGSDLTKFKPQKGADVLLAILVGLKKRVGADKFHVLIAGPRRHWLRNHMDRLGISYTFDGKISAGDDYPKNILSLERINLLTNLLDLYIVSSRWEGAPHAVFETIAARRKIISSRVAVANDILSSQALFGNVGEAIEIIYEDMRTGALEKQIQPNWVKAWGGHSVERVREHWRAFYDELSSPEPLPVLAEPVVSSPVPIFAKPLAALSKVRGAVFPRKAVTLWGENAFLNMLAREFDRRGLRVNSDSTSKADGHILSSSFFDLERARLAIRAAKKPLKAVHLIDEDFSINRGPYEKVFNFNREIATTTVFQSVHSWVESLKLGFDPINPMIIRKACDADFIYPPADVPNLAGRKIRLISRSLSNNPGNELEIYSWLDRNLNFDKYEYVFVGSARVSFQNIRHIEGMESKELGELLRQSDVFIAASQKDLDSSSLIEAINTGLPALFANGGGRAEVAGYAGLGFDSAEEIPLLLEKLVFHYESYRFCAYSKSLREIADQYLNVLGL